MLICVFAKTEKIGLIDTLFYNQGNKSYSFPIDAFFLFDTPFEIQKLLWNSWGQQ